MNEKMITIKEFCQKYKVSPQGVYAKIKRKSAQLDGHIEKSNGQLVIDSYAEKVLFPRPPDSFLIEKNNSLQAELSAKSVKVSSLTLDTDLQKKKIASLRSEAAENYKKATDYQNQLSQKILEVKNLESQLADEKVKNESFEKSLSALSNEMKKISDMMCLLSDENAKLIETVHLLHSENNDKDKLISELRGKIEELENSASKKLFGFSSKKV